MLRHSRHLKSGEFTVVWVFLAAALLGLIAGAHLVWHAAATAQPVVTAPTDDEYRAEAGSIMGPFVSQASAMTAADFDRAEPGALRTLITATQERMLRLRVPGDLRDAHLAFVLLLDRWNRALDGGADVRAEAVSQLRAALDANPWVAPASAQAL